MFLTYLRRELRRRRKAALVVASGLALGIALLIVVSSVSSGMEKAQAKVLESLYGPGTDMTVTKAAAAPTENEADRPRFEFDACAGYRACPIRTPPPTGQSAAGERCCRHGEPRS